MKDYKTLSDSALLKNIRIDAEKERHSGLAVIHQLREVARREVWQRDLGCGRSYERRPASRTPELFARQGPGLDVGSATQ